MEERYKKYLEKAKSVSVSLWASHCTFSLCFADVSKYSTWTVTPHTEGHEESFDKKSKRPWSKQVAPAPGYLLVTKRESPFYVGNEWQPHLA